MPRVRSLVVALVVCALGVVGVQAPSGAATGSDFDPGFIVSDEVFYDATAMNEAQIKAFIDTKGARCVASAGNTCLKDYRETTTTVPGDAYCATYTGAAAESAARIIAKASAACGLNPQVLLVTLQKEQSLVTTTTGKPSATFRRALGFGCPDNTGGWCDPAYSGFFVQVQRAARQFQVYRSRPNAYSYVAGRTNTILYHPNRACGTQQVVIRNQATAGLYIYTPYVPNAAALAAGYGTGDACSSYGNRNFFLYFSDWFGSTGFAVSPWIWDWYQVSTNRAAAGEPTAAPTTVAGGVRQQFQGGSVLVSGAHGIHLVPAGLILMYYDALGGPAGVLGFPSGAHSAPGGGLSQPFQNGTVYISGASGFAYVSGWMLDHYRGTGGPTGPLGFPTSPQGVVGGGLNQSFQGGTVWISGVGGVRTLSGTVQSAFVESGGPLGPLGFPVADATTSSGITEQRFQHGVMYSDGSTTSYATGLPLAVLEAGGGPGGPLGIPTAPQRVVAGGIVQPFRNSTLYISGVGGIQTIAAGGLVEAYYGAVGGPAGVLGWPTGTTTAVAGGIEHPFVNGRMYISGATGFTYATGWMDEIYRGSGGPSGWLGFPTDSTHVEAGGLAQSFQNGSIYVSGVGGVQFVPQRVRTAYLERGGPAGSLGFPVDAAMRTNTTTLQRFQGGTLVLHDDGTVEIWPPA